MQGKRIYEYPSWFHVEAIILMSLNFITTFVPFKRSSDGRGLQVMGEESAEDDKGIQTASLSHSKDRASVQSF